MQPNITFVTAFINIDRVTNDPMTKYENYFGWIEQLLAIPINLYFITTSDIHGQLKYQPRDSLKFCIIDKKQLPYFDRLSDIDKCWAHYRTNNKAKDTAKFACLTNCKFYFVQQAIDNNPFNSTHYAWIDAGIFKVIKPANLNISEILVNLNHSDKIKLLMLNYISKQEIIDNSFVLCCRYKIAGGFLLVQRIL